MLWGISKEFALEYLGMYTHAIGHVIRHTLEPSGEFLHMIRAISKVVHLQKEDFNS